MEVSVQPMFKFMRYLGNTSTDIVKRLVSGTTHIPGRSRTAVIRDHVDPFCGLGFDPGGQKVISANLTWLIRAQEQSTTLDGGVASHFCLCDGWSASYPETTGYIVTTFLREGSLQQSEKLEACAKRMLDWLISIQFPDGSFQGGKVTDLPVVPVTFNTGQILLGLAAGARAFGDAAYADGMNRAADWLVRTQDRDGCWRRFGTPFAAPGEKAYETHVAWSLFEAERVSPGNKYGEAGLRQVWWALSKQNRNGWFDNCCLTDCRHPLTHTIGYALRGIIEAYRLSEEAHFLEAARRTADSLASRVGANGLIAGRFDASWDPVVDWACLTGSAQLAYCWLQLFEWTGDPRYLRVGKLANAFLRRTVATAGNPNKVGGVSGAFPISGDYGKFRFLSWAAKFCVDAQRKELEQNST